MIYKDKIYKKKLRINYLLVNQSLDLLNSEKKLLKNPEEEHPKEKISRQLLIKKNQQIHQIHSLEKEGKQKKIVQIKNEQREHIRVIYKQVNSQCNLFANAEYQELSMKALKKEKSKGFLLDYSSKKERKADQNKNKQLMINYELPKSFNRYSSLNGSCENLTLRNVITKDKSETFRCDKEGKPIFSPQIKKQQKKMKLDLFKHQNQPFVNLESSGKSLTNMTSILNLKPKKYVSSKRATKLTAMNKYDLGYENIRLAHKLLSMKPTKPCDLKEQKRFYKKQEYFKEIRSRTIEMNEPVYFDSISQSISFPKINERFHTTIE